MQHRGHDSMETWPGRGSAQMQYRLRPYAVEASDLDIDFSATSQAELAIRVVANCLGSPRQELSNDEVWSWSLKKRLQALLAITQATRGSELLLQVRCTDGDCNEEIELPLDLDHFRQEVADEEFVFEAGSTPLTVRLPTGSDQLQWQDSRQDSGLAMARRLVLKVDGVTPDADWKFPEDWLPELSQFLERHDELMTLEISSSCPNCAREFDCAVDLEAQLLACLSLTQQELLLQVHQLALAYHWSEAEILRLTPARRRFYLQRLQAMTEGAALQ